MKKAEIRYSTRDDAVQFFGINPKSSFIGVSLIVDNVVVGIGGFSFESGYVKVFCDLKDDARKYKRLIVKGCKMVMEKANERKRCILAVRDDQEKNSKRLLESLGFEYFMQNADGSEVWKWHN